MPDLRQALKDFVATSNSGKYDDEETLLSKFPELKGYNVQTLRDFVATSNSGKYATEDEIFSKFPEFNIGGVSSKKKGSLESATQQTQMQNTTGLPSEDGSSGMVSQRVKDKQAVLTKRALAKYEEDNAAPYSSGLGKAFAGTVAVLGEMNKSVYQFADDLIVSARKGLQEEGFFDDDIPDTNTPITDAIKKKTAPKKNKDGAKNLVDYKMMPFKNMQYDGGPLDPTPLIKGTAKLALKIINSSLSQSKKNIIISALNYYDVGLKNKIKEVEYLQEQALPEDNIAVNVTKGIVGMAPDLLAASVMKSPAAAEGRLAKWGTEVSKDAKPLIAKYVPKATKFIEEAVRAPFTKIMAAKGTASGIANAEEGEDIMDAGLEGFVKGGAEGMYMHALGVAAGKSMPFIAKQISKTGLNSTFATAIANPLANAGVFTTAKALRTGIEEQRLISAEEGIMEAATGVGFSLLHAGSLYKNHKELNHYYDNTLKTDPLGSFGRVINETKDNLELVYNPDLTETQVKDLESARDDLKKAIIEEPDLNNKKLLGDEALKIQNQLDAHSAVKGIVENKDYIIEAINANENLSEEVKSQKTKKVAAIADFFDTSEFGLQKKELDTRIDDAQKKLDDASLGFTNLTKASDRKLAKNEIEKRRAELEGLNKELDDLIDNKETITTEKPEEVVEPRIKDSQITLKRETFEVESISGDTMIVEVTTRKDGSRKIIQKDEEGSVAGGELVSKDNTLTTEEFITNGYGDIKGEPKVEQGNDIMNPKMKEKLTPKQKAELGIEETAPTETTTETAPVEALKDVESTTKALENIPKTLDSISDYDFSEYNYLEDISKAYHEAKVDGSNPELVKAVEELLAPKVEEPTNEIVLDIDAAEKRIAEEKAQPEELAAEKEISDAKPKGLEPNEGVDSNIDRFETYSGNKFEITLSNVDETGQSLPRGEGKKKIMIKTIGSDGTVRVNNALTKTFETAAEAKEYANKFIEKDTVRTEEQTIINAKPEEVIEPSMPLKDALADTSGIYYLNGERGEVNLDGQTVVFETKDKIIELGNVEELAENTLDDFDISYREFDLKLNDDNSIELNGKKYLNNYSEPESAFSRDKDGNYTVTLETENGQKRTFRGQQADRIVYETRLKNFEKNGTERQIEEAHTAADEAIRIETEARESSPKREGKSVRKGKQRTLKTVKEPLTKSERIQEETSVLQDKIKLQELNESEEYNAKVKALTKGEPMGSFFDTYTKAKKEGSNPELVKAVDDLLAIEYKAPKGVEGMLPVGTEVEVDGKKGKITETSNFVGEQQYKVSFDGNKSGSEYITAKDFNKRGKAIETPKAEAKATEAKAEAKAKLTIDEQMAEYIDEANSYQDEMTKVENDNSLTEEQKNSKIDELEKKYMEALKKSNALAFEKARTKSSETKPKAEPKADEVKDLLDLDTKDKTNLQRVSDYLDRLDKSLDINPNELNDVTRVMAVGTAKAVIKTLKALVDAGITLQEAIKMASAAHKVKPEQITDALDIVSKINENKSEGISEFELKGYNKLSKVIDSAISNGKTIDNVLNYMKRSEVYKSASDVQKELLVRDVRNRFGLKEKSAPSVAKLFGKLKDVTKITMSEMKLIHNDIKMQNLGAKQVIKTFNEKKAELTEATDELVKQGKITTQQASNVVKRFAKVNLLSETSVGRFTEYMAKVFNKADYAKKLNDGKVFKKDIAKLSRNKDKNVNLTELGKKFSEIDPSMVENIDKYNAIAADVKEAIKGSTKRLEKINWAGTVKIEDVSKYIKETIEAQELKLREEKIAELQDLMGVDTKDFSAAEIDKLLRTDKKMTKDNSAIAKATIEKGFDTYSTMIKETIETGKDPFTGEDVSYKPKDVEVVKQFMDMDLGRLTDKQALSAADALHNFLVNRSTANMENVLRQYKGALNAKEFLTTGGKKGTGRVAKELRKYFSKNVGNFLTRKGTPMGGVFTKLFKGVEAGSEFSRLSGFSEIQRGKNYALTAVKNISNDYIKKFFNKKSNGEKFNTAYNEAERGIVADLRRSTPGNEAEEFKRRVDILDQSIKELEKGSPEEVKKAELYQRVYDKVVEGSKDLSDVESKTDKLNLEAIEFWQNQHEIYFDDLANYMLNVHNTILEKGVNYASPDRYAKLSEEAPEKLLDNEAMYGAGGEHLYKKEASGLMKAQYPKDLPKGRYRDYSFDKNNVNSMRDALVDMKTGGAIRQLEAFRESAEYKKIIPSIFDRNMVNKRMTDYVANTRNKGDYGVEDSKLIKVLDKTATIGAGMVLGSPLQAVKQTIPIIPNTIINAGKIGFTGAFDPKFNKFLNESGYATGLRGVESQLEISSLNKKIELAAEGTPAQLGKAIENANKWWLKTFLVKPDVFIARSSWQAYYEQSLERQGLSTKGIDYSDHKINEKAGNYAEEMVSRQQNVSDQDLAGEWFTKNTPDAKILKKIFLNMASFRMNQSARLGADLTTLEYWNTSTTADKITAARSLAGYGAEMLTFRILSAAAILGIGSLAKQIKGEEESDVDWEERYNNVLKGQLTSSIVDTFSPAPFLDMGVKATLSPASEKLEEVTGLPLSIYGVEKEDWLRQLGAYGMAPQRLYEIEQAAELGFSGTYTDDFGNEKKISEEDQKTIKELLPFYAATGLGILPTDVATGIKNVIKFSKKKVTTDEEVADIEMALGEKEANVNEKLEILSDLSERSSNPDLQQAADIKISELLVEDVEEKKQLVESRKLEKEQKDFLLYDELNDTQYDNESDLKKYNKRLWNKNFGPNSQWFKDHKYEKEIESRLEKELTKREEKQYNYKKRNSDGSSKRKYGSSSRSGGSSKSEMYNSDGVLVTKTRTTTK